MHKESATAKKVPRNDLNKLMSMVHSFYVSWKVLLHWSVEVRSVYFLHRVSASTMFTFYRGILESILSSCITVWYGTSAVFCWNSLQRRVTTAEKVIGE